VVGGIHRAVDDGINRGAVLAAADHLKAALAQLGGDRCAERVAFMPTSA
jgi:hypothetical protein